MTVELPRSDEHDDDEYDKTLRAYYFPAKDVRSYPHDRQIIKTALQSADYDASSALAEFFVVYLQEYRQVELLTTMSRRSTSKREAIMQEQQTLRTIRTRRKEIGVGIFGDEEEDITKRTKTIFLHQRVDSIKKGSFSTRGREQDSRETFIHEISQRFPLTKVPFRPR